MVGAFIFGGQRGAYGSPAEHLAEELHRVDGLVRAQLLRFKAACPEDQRERFWHIPDAQLDLLANDDTRTLDARFEPTDKIAEILAWVRDARAAIDRRLAATPDSGPDLRLRRLVLEFGLTPLERDALLLAVLPALHSTYRRTYGVLQFDPARAYPTAAFLAEMLTFAAGDLSAAQATFGARAPLMRHRLLTIGGGDDEPLGTRVVTVDERITQFLNGGDGIDARLESFATLWDETVNLRDLPIPAEAINRLDLLPHSRPIDDPPSPPLRLEFLGPDSGLAVRAFATIAAALDRRLMVVDTARVLTSAVPWPLAIDLALRDARLERALPMFTNVPVSDEADVQTRQHYLFDRLNQFPHAAAIETGVSASGDGRAAVEWLPFTLPLPTVVQREKLWKSQLDTEKQLAATGPPTDWSALACDLASAFQLTDSQIRDVSQAARVLARRRDLGLTGVTSDDLFGACRRLSSSRLVAFAQRIEPRSNLTLDRDVVLPPSNKRALMELRNRIHHHTRVHGVMELGPHMRLGRGVMALFVGGSGTGKSITAEVLATEHKVDLYRVDLAALTSKWVGETERNLSKVFADAERANCMLFFDEADAMFGRRGEVKEARDRWANLEVNYLLQRIEDYSGVVILATNLRQNIDEAFQRRIHVVVDFPTPDAELRKKLWTRLLPVGEHLDLTDADLEDIAQRFELTGGNIRNVVLDACVRTLAQRSTKVGLRHVIASIAREYQKSSRPVTEGDFSRYYEWAMSDVVMPETVEAVQA